MPSLNANLVGRINRLPKPASVTDSLQPTFEAVSNAIQAITTRFRKTTHRRGVVSVVITLPKRRRELRIVVSDNGIGLDKTNWEAFLTTDTENKIEIGGKGVGRLLWLDCFDMISVRSIYLSGKVKNERRFKFRLSNDEQITELSVTRVSGDADVGTEISLNGFRRAEYRDNFPKRKGIIFQHVLSHFLPVFVGGNSPQVDVTIDDETRSYPSELDNFISKREDVDPIENSDFGPLRLIMLECHKSASSDLKGTHFIHFVANNRTVVSQAIDNKLGFKAFGDNNDRVFHACLFGQYLDRNVNQERTGFNFSDSKLDDIVSDICMPYIGAFLIVPMREHGGQQREIIDQIVETYPSVEFGPMEELQSHIPIGELHDDAVYGHLARERFRRDQRQAEKIKEALQKLRGGLHSYSDLRAAVTNAIAAMERQEQKSLAEYVLRRKVVLDFIEALVRRTAASDSDSSFQSEDILHGMICPINTSTLDENGVVTAATSHDLWIVDERLTLAQYFHSDKSFNSLSKAFGSEDRADIIVFNTAHSLRNGLSSDKVLIVEFKRPGRENYSANDNPYEQVVRYVRKLQEGHAKDLNGRPIKPGPDTVFYCFIVADIIGKIDEWTWDWERTIDGRGRRYVPSSGFKGAIEVIGWDALLQDAKDRNAAFFERAGLSGKSVFSAD